MLVDTHCHIHEKNYSLPVHEVLDRAQNAGVTKMITVGTSQESSRDAVRFAAKYDNVYAAVGVHPHDAKDGWSNIVELASAGVVAIGEIGLDYYYDYSPRDVQTNALEQQLQVARDNDLPVIFHVRDAKNANRGSSVWNDFWSILDNFSGVRGVLHSFTDTQVNLDQGFERGLYVGVNGISTFTKDTAQQGLFAGIPLDRLMFETDAPFLTPAPFRGTINEPAYVRKIAEFHAEARGVQLDELAQASSANAISLFGI